MELWNHGGVSECKGSLHEGLEVIGRTNLQAVIAICTQFGTRQSD